MVNEETRKYIANLLNRGVSLSEILKKLKEEKDINITFFDLRLLASELESIDWSKHDTKEVKKEKSSVDNNEVSDEVGKTVVELSRISRPGSLASGSVTFASGAKGEWMLDQFGRLALEKKEGEPTENDIKEFQVELQSILSSSMI